MTNNSNLIAKLHTSQILVGLDLGEKTIGIAVSDQSLIVATPLKTISREGIKKDLIKLSEILKEYNFISEEDYKVILAFQEKFIIELNEKEGFITNKYSG